MANNPQNQPNFSSPPNFQQNLYASPNPQIPSQQSSYISPTTFPYYGNDYSSQSPQMRPARHFVGQARSSRAILQENDVSGDCDVGVEEEHEELEDQVEDDVEVEGATPLAETMSIRGNNSNWSIEEDIALCSAYLQAGGDTEKGADQKGKHYWGAIFKLYEEARLENPKKIGIRNSEGLRNRWKRVNQGVGKFAGIFAEASRMRQSGKSDDDVLNEARKIFAGPMNKKGQTGPKFMLEHCWDLLKEFPKWNGLPAEDASSVMGGSSKRSTPEGTSTDSEVVKRRKGKGKSVEPVSSEQVDGIHRMWEEKDAEQRAFEAEKHRFNMEMFEFQKLQQQQLMDAKRQKFRMKNYHTLMKIRNRTPEEEERYAKLDAEFKSYE